MKPTILFAGAKSVGAACLEQIVSACEDGHGTLVGVVKGRPRNASLSEGPTVEEIAADAAVEVFEDWPEELCADYIISVQYQSILTAAQLAQANIRAVNLHLAPLPEYRGANQFSFAILNEETEFGVTLHEMVPKVDAGEILGERRFPINSTDVISELYNRALKEAVILFRDSIRPLLAGQLTPRDQESERPGAKRRFYRKKDIETEKRLDPSWPIKKIARHVRAMDMPGFEPPHFEHEGRKIYLSYRWDS